MCARESEERKVKGFRFLLAICFLAVFSESLNTISLKVFIYQLSIFFFQSSFPFLFSKGFGTREPRPGKILHSLMKGIHYCQTATELM